LPPERNDADLAHAARLYFIDGMSQKEVADEMQTTRSNVSRMLTAAKERGVVQIRIMIGRDHELERELMDRFGLAEALVASF
jgi:DNA-binding transcriptional regulator LsrR (DeoR family)